MTLRRVQSALLFTVFLAVPALADTAKMKPGLWENSVSFKTESGELERAMGEMERRLASMPPEQRQMMQQMMAAQGISIGPKATTVRVCISEEEAARGLVPPPESNCKQEVLAQNESTTKISFDCAEANGEAEIRFESPTSFTGKAIMNATAEGRTERITMDQRGKWLSADCGALAGR